jgi:hypothetical protein
MLKAYHIAKAEDQLYLTLGQNVLLLVCRAAFYLPEVLYICTCCWVSTKGERRNHAS